MKRDKAVRTDVFPGPPLLADEGNFASRMVAGIDAYLKRELAAARDRRGAYWHRDFTSPDAYVRSVEPNRQRLRKIIGVVDARDEPRMEAVAPLLADGSHARATSFGEGSVIPVRWRVFRGVHGEGVLAQTPGDVVADIILLPDCDCQPEMLLDSDPYDSPCCIPVEALRTLMVMRCRVLIPSLVDRDCAYSGIPSASMTNQPHREFIYRAAYEMGRHIIGYEVQKVLAAVDWLRSGSGHRPLGVFGHGEGGLIALYSAAVDLRIDAAAVSGYFGPREGLWQEPLYRNVFGLLAEFGDAEIASLIAPRPLVVHTGPAPEVPGPPAPSPGRNGAAPGAIRSPMAAAVATEVERARQLVLGLEPPAPITLVSQRDADGNPEPSTVAAALLAALGLPARTSTVYVTEGGELPPSGNDIAPMEGDVACNVSTEERAPAPISEAGSRPKGETPPYEPPEPFIQARRKRQFEELIGDTQRLLWTSAERRTAYWSNADAHSVARWEETCGSYRETFWNEIIGRLPPATLPANPRSRVCSGTSAFYGYEVRLDVYPEVFACGILLVPIGLRDGERRPVVVCQHGLEGRPQNLADPSLIGPYYRQFACRLAEQGFVTFSPQNPYVGGEDFRVLLRKAQPLGLTLFSFIVRQHERILEWLGSLPFVDPDHIGFYGLSYGGKTAMRVPALLPGYCLSICSGDFNEWAWKCASSTNSYSYLITGEYDMPEFNLGETFNYAEMAGLICPRPFMVERGHDDPVGQDEWVAHEYARVRRLYDRLGIGDRTEIEFFNGGHEVHLERTVAFLRRNLTDS